MMNLTELLARAPTVDAALVDDPNDPAGSLAWLLHMAARTRDAAPAPVDPAVVDQLEAILRTRPDRDEALGQLHIDAASCLRRADLIDGDGPILAVGDDDCVTLALQRHSVPGGRVEGRAAVCAVDLDARLLSFLAEHGVETHRADFFAESVPAPLRGRFAAAVTDPFRDLDGGLGFLCFAAACLRPGGALFWVDDPVWNPEHDAVRAAMAALGWRVVETQRDVHAYPLSEASFDPTAILDALDVDPAWLRALIAQTSAWSNLYRLVLG